MANTQKANAIISYGLQNKKSKQDIYAALLKEGVLDATTQSYVKSLGDDNLFKYEQETPQGVDPKQVYQDALKFAVDNKNSDDVNTRMRANKFLMDVENKKILPTGQKINDDVAAAILQNPQTYHDTMSNMSMADKTRVNEELARAGFTVPRKLNATEKETQVQAESGLTSINDMRSEVFNPDGTIRTGNLAQEAMPFAIGARSLRRMKNDAKDILTRIRTGAALNESEVKFYSQLVPSTLDSAEDAKYKLDQLEVLYSGLSGSEVNLKNKDGKVIKYTDMFDPRQRAEVRAAMKNGFELYHPNQFEQVYGKTVVEGDPANQIINEPNNNDQPEADKGTLDEIKSISPLEIGKGMGKGAVATANDLSKLGQNTLGRLADMIVSKITGKEIKSDISSIPEEYTKAENTGQKIGKVGEFIAEMAVPAGPAIKVGKIAGKVIGKGASKLGEAITPIEKSVETVLKETKLEKLNRYAEQATKAVENNKEITPLEMAGKVADDALTLMKNKMKEIGNSKTEITKAIADTNVGDIVKTASQNLRSMVSERLGTTFTKDGFSNAAGRVSAISDKADRQLLESAYKKLQEVGKKPTFQKVDDAIDFMQDILYKRNSNTAIPVNKKAEAIVKKIIGDLNDNLKNIGGENYQKINSEYSRYKKTSDTLNSLLGKEGNRAGALMKRIFSPSDAGTKKLFAEVKELTGVDLVNEATLAKFVMESLGDSRQTSLLKEAIEGGASGKVGIANKVINTVLNKIQNPIGKARSIINKSN